jgi:hypothetical protein
VRERLRRYGVKFHVRAGATGCPIQGRCRPSSAPGGHRASSGSRIPRGLPPLDRAILKRQTDVGTQSQLPPGSGVGCISSSDPAHVLLEAKQPRPVTAGRGCFVSIGSRRAWLNGSSLMTDWIQSCMAQPLSLRISRLHNVDGTERDVWVPQDTDQGVKFGFGCSRVQRASSCLLQNWPSLLRSHRSGTG